MMLQGKAMWAKIVGAPGKGFSDTEPQEWSIDVIVNEQTKKMLEDEGIGHKIKTHKTEGYDFITFKRKATKRDGTNSKPIEIVDERNQPWDDDVKIGNGSVVGVKFLINDVPYGGKVHRKPGILKVKVFKLVEFEGRDSEDFPETDEVLEAWDA